MARELYRQEHNASAGMRAGRVLIFFMITVSVLLVVVGIVLAVIGRTRDEILGLCLPGICFLACSLWAKYRGLPWYLKKRLDHTIIGLCHLNLDMDGLSARTLSEELRFSWQNVDEVRTEDDSVFLYMDSRINIVVPQQGVTEGNYSEFRRELEQRITENNA